MINETLHLAAPAPAQDISVLPRLNEGRILKAIRKTPKAGNIWVDRGDEISL